MRYFKIGQTHLGSRLLDIDPAIVVVAPENPLERVIVAQAMAGVIRLNPIVVGNGTGHVREAHDRPFAILADPDGWGFWQADFGNGGPAPMALVLRPDGRPDVLRVYGEQPDDWETIYFDEAFDAFYQWRRDEPTRPAWAHSDLVTVSEAVDGRRSAGHGSDWFGAGATSQDGSQPVATSQPGSQDATQDAGRLARPATQDGSQDGSQDVAAVAGHASPTSGASGACL